MLYKDLINKAKQGEKILKDYGFKNSRFRIHNNLARIEIPLFELEDFIRKRKEIIGQLKELNLDYITLDLEGLRSGSMDINQT